MTDTFVPLPRPAASATKAAFTPLPLKIFSQAAPPTQTGNEGQPAHNENCREPALTLQRDGDKIKGIHIECGCGQVIDLVCEY